MTDYTELKRLAEAFPSDLDWDSNTEPFFNGPSGESLGGGSTGFYCVYGAPFEIDGEQYDGHTYVETCKVDFAKFMCAARDGVLALTAENDSQRKDLQNQRSDKAQLIYALKQEQKSYLVLRAERDQLKAENEALRQTLTECSDSLHGEMLQKFGGQLPDDMHPATRREYDRDMAEVAGYHAAMGNGGQS